MLSRYVTVCVLAFLAVTAGCTGSQVRRAEEALDKAAIEMDELTHIIDQLEADQLLQTSDVKQYIAPSFLALATADREAEIALRRNDANTARVALLAASSALDNLSRAASARVVNPASQRRLVLAVESLRVVLESALGILQ